MLASADAIAAVAVFLFGAAGAAQVEATHAILSRHNLPASEVAKWIAVQNAADERVN